MAELSSEGRILTRKLSGLLYVSASFFVGMHFFVTHHDKHLTSVGVEELYPSSLPIALYLGGFLFVVAVAFHIFFAWRYSRQFDNRWAFSCAVYFAAVNGTMFGLPVLLSRTTLSAEAKSMVYEGAAAFLIVLPIVIGLVQFILFMRRGPRKGTWRAMQRGPTSMRVWEADDLNSEERSRIDEFLRQRMGELSGGFERDEKE